MDSARNRKKEKKISTFFPIVNHYDIFISTGWTLKHWSIVCVPLYGVCHYVQQSKCTVHACHCSAYLCALVSVIQSLYVCTYTRLVAALYLTSTLHLHNPTMIIIIRNLLWSSRCSLGMCGSHILVQNRNIVLLLTLSLLVKNFDTFIVCGSGRAFANHKCERGNPYPFGFYTRRRKEAAERWKTNAAVYVEGWRKRIKRKTPTNLFFLDGQLTQYTHTHTHVA